MIASPGVNATSYNDTSVAENNSYTYRVRAQNIDGTSLYTDEETITVELPPLAYAVSETTTHGTRSGNYTNTRQPSGSEAITEVETNGKPSRRTSRLQHTWRVDGVRGGAMVELRISASASDSGENDNFDFTYSTDGQQSWQAAFTLDAGTTDDLLAQLPGAVGTVYVRVVDSNRSQGRRSLDSIAVSFIEIKSESDPISLDTELA